MVRGTFSDRERSSSFPHLPLVPRGFTARPSHVLSIFVTQKKNRTAPSLIRFDLCAILTSLARGNRCIASQWNYKANSKKMFFFFQFFLEFKGIVFKKELKFPYYISSRIFDNIIAKWAFLRRTVFFGQKLLSKVAIIKTKSATIAIFSLLLSFSSLFLFLLSF